jgi:hypothetical protein
MPPVLQQLQRPSAEEELRNGVPIDAARHPSKTRHRVRSLAGVLLHGPSEARIDVVVVGRLWFIEGRFVGDRLRAAEGEWCGHLEGAEPRWDGQQPGRGGCGEGQEVENLPNKGANMQIVGLVTIQNQGRDYWSKSRVYLPANPPGQRPYLAPPPFFSLARPALPSQ